MEDGVVRREKEGGKEKEREGGREGEGGTERGREGEREGGSEGERGREGEREGGRVPSSTYAEYIVSCHRMNAEVLKSHPGILSTMSDHLFGVLEGFVNIR